MQEHNEQPHTSITDSVMEKISLEHVPQKGRAYFVVRKVALVVGLAVCLAALVFGMSLVLFSLRLTGAWFALRAEGVRFVPSLGLLPGILLAGLVVVGACTELLLRKFGFGYRKPLIYSGVLLAVFTFAVGYGLTKTPLHRAMYERAHMPGPGGPAWSGLYPAPKPDLSRSYIVGVVHDISGTEFSLRTRATEELRVLITADTELPPGRALVEDDFVLVLGPLREGVVQARRVQFVPDELRR
ncbi:MAG: hypothetical protein KBD66_02245 [Candidatus Doudnabacteria bacterium]|nr:hypothetical protein [Candidatus Doudnabacteria bacterium]